MPTSGFKETSPMKLKFMSEVGAMGSAPQQVFERSGSAEIKRVQCWSLSRKAGLGEVANARSSLEDQAQKGTCRGLRSIM